MENSYDGRIYCENASRLGRGVGVHPQCLMGRKEYKVTIKDGVKKSYPLYLCNECLAELRRDSDKYGYSLTVRSI